MDDLLQGFNETDRFNNGERNVSYSDGVLTVTYHRNADDDWLGDATIKHFRLVEVEQQWVEVDRG